MPVRRLAMTITAILNHAPLPRITCIGAEPSAPAWACKRVVSTWLLRTHDPPARRGPAEILGTLRNAAVSPAHIPHSRHVGTILLPDQIRHPIAVQVGH